MTRMPKAAALAALAVLPCLASPTGARAAWPDHPITAIVPFDVGGGSDILARIVSARLQPLLGQNVVVQNKPGAGGNVGGNFVAHAKPDGYTVLFTATSATQNPALYKHMPYDPEKDLIGVAETGEAYDIVAVSVAKVPSTNLKDFVQLLRDHPGKYNASAGGLATMLNVQFFRITNNVNIEILMYNSAGDAATALMTGEADFMVVDGSAIKPGIDAGKTRPLAATGDERIPAYPNLPTTTEAGLPQYKDFVYHALYVPGGTSPEIIAKLHDAVNKVTSDPEVNAQFHKLGWVTTQKTQKQYEAFYLEEIAKWKKVVSEAKIPTVD